MSGSAPKEAVVALLIVLLAVFAWNPFDVFMPSRTEMMVAGGLLAAFALFAVFISRERPQDEREAIHQMASGRAAYLAGTGILALGVAAQTAMHMLDGWLAGALVAMVVAKVAARAWYEDRH